MSGNFEDRRMPPMDGAVAAATIGTSASAAATLTNGPSATTPGGYYTFEARGGDIYVVFGTSSSMGAPTLTANSLCVPNGQQRDWYIGANVTHYRALATAASSTLLWSRS